MLDFLHRREAGRAPLMAFIDTYDAGEASLLAKQRELLLRIACSDDIGRVERAMLRGSDRLKIYVRYNAAEKFDRDHPGFAGEVNIMKFYAGRSVEYSRREVDRALRSMSACSIRPYGLPNDAAWRIVTESGGKCFLCGRTVSECGDLSVQDMFPWNNPYVTATHHEDGHRHRAYASEREIGMCRALCGDCLRLWRMEFETNVRYGCLAWMQERGIRDFDKLIQEGFCFSDGRAEWKDAAEKFRTAAGTHCRDRMAEGLPAKYVPKAPLRGFRFIAR